MKTKRRVTAGFTLIELLIALGLMAIFALLAYRGLDSVLRLNRAAQSHDAQAAARLRVVTQLEADLRQAHSVSIATEASGGQSLKLKRRSAEAQNAVDGAGAGGWATIVWTLDSGTLTRRADAQNAALLPQTSQLSWWVHQSTPVPSSSPWQAAAVQAEADTRELPVRRAVMLRLTHQGLAFEKAFLIGR